MLRGFGCLVAMTIVLGALAVLAGPAAADTPLTFSRFDDATDNTAYIGDASRLTSQSLAAGPGNTMWAAQSAVGQTSSTTGRLVRFSVNGTAAGLYKIKQGIRLTQPVSLTRGPGNTMYYVGTGRIGRLSTLTSPSATFATPQQGVTDVAMPTSSPFAFLSGITLGPDGNLWWTTSGDFIGTHGRIGRIQPDLAGAVEFTTGITSYPTGAITVGPDGNLWFGEMRGSSDGMNAVARITPDGTVTEYPVTDGAVLGITAGPDGNVWFTEVDGKIGRITPGGTLTEFPTNLGERKRPWGIVPGPDGALWFTEYGYTSFPTEGGGIVRITTDGTITDMTSTITGFTDQIHPSAIAMGPDGNLWFNADTGGGGYFTARLDRAPTNQSAPKVTYAAGIPSARVGSPLYAFAGAWTGSLTAPYGYRWQRETTPGTWEDISGATGGTYTPVLADSGLALRVVETAYNRASSRDAASAPTDPVFGPPPAPTFGRPTPASPSQSRSVKVGGMAQPGATVRLYPTADCSGPAAATGTASALGKFAATATVAADTTTTFHATATNVVGTSPCSPTSLTYVNDRTAPAAPAFTATSPASPNRAATPKVLGMAEAGATVRLYTTADCTGTPARTGTAAAFAAPGLAVAVPDHSTVVVRGTATDAAGNTSGCSSVGISYQRP